MFARPAHRARGPDWKSLEFRHWAGLLGAVGLLALAAITYASSSRSPSGQSMPKGNIPGWRQVFADDFNRNVARGNFPGATNGKWGAYPNGWKDTSGNGTYNCSKVCSVHDGILDLWLRTEGGVHYAAVPYPQIPGGNDFRYGRYVVRFRSDPVPGYKVAWLLWPESNVWPRDGEIDFPEGNLTDQICAFIHRQGATRTSDQHEFCSGGRFSAWHTAVTEWRPGRADFILDGQVVGSATTRIPNTPMHWVLQTETQLDETHPSPSATGHVQIDWVAVYRPA